MKTDTALWQAINAYDIDAADVALPFSRRLARDNGWTQDFARQAIAEYKRFIYLVCVSGHTLTPSEEVDSVWHLHLIYTRDYWDRFCGETLKRPVHHGPTQGGQVEANKYLTIYRRTLALYEAEFGATPPCDLWPNETDRFAPRSICVVDTRTHLVAQKRPVVFTAMAASMFALAACSSETLMAAFVPKALAFVITGLVLIVIVSVLSSFRRTKKGDGSGSGCGAGGCSSGDGGSGCGGGCGGD